MIDRREIIDTATALGLGPQVVEKDYALSWLLAGISAHKELRDSWVFKGGTCLKKCFFETYRFSEDLDFTLQDESHLDEKFLQRAFAEISDWIYQTSGLELPVDYQNFEILNNPRGNPSCQGKVSYRGPISPRSERQLPRVKLDLTADERLVLPPERLPIYHPYSDVPTGGIEVLTYVYEEAFGEKVRALGERTRPRDLYDVINLFRNEKARPSAAILLDVLMQKCEFKGISVPDMALKLDISAPWRIYLGNHDSHRHRYEDGKWRLPQQAGQGQPDHVVEKRYARLTAVFQQAAQPVLLAYPPCVMTRISPSWATDATRTPSTVNILPRLNPLEPADAGLSMATSIHSSNRN